MSEQNSPGFEQEAEGFVAPPPPPFPPQSEKLDGPQLSTAETLTGIFFDPARVFESFRPRPRFLVAAIIITLLTVLFSVAFFQRVGYENIMRSAIENNPRADQMTEEQKDKMMDMYRNPIVKAFTYVSPIFGMAVFLAAGAGIYLLGVMAMGKSTTYSRTLSVWTYSSFPPFVLSMLANFVLLMLKSPEDMDMAQMGRGLVHANLSFLVDSKASPVLATLLAAFDVFKFYGLFLASLGLQKVAKLKSGAAWTIVLAIWLIGTVIAIAWSLITGNPMG
ncbi:MAG TPA: Yip1 family protein [Pyrinomonadaceae bacterium]|nr:Yip1 family protein [Pyrinomonadaceae bacterium]